MGAFRKPLMKKLFVKVKKKTTKFFLVGSLHNFKNVQ